MPRLCKLFGSKSDFALRWWRLSIVASATVLSMVAAVILRRTVSPLSIFSTPTILGIFLMLMVPAVRMILLVGMQRDSPNRARDLLPPLSNLFLVSGMSLILLDGRFDICFSPMKNIFVLVLLISNALLVIETCWRGLQIVAGCISR